MGQNIEYANDMSDQVIYCHLGNHDLLNNDTKLVVNSNQTVVVYCDGNVLDVLRQGVYTNLEKAMPLLKMASVRTQHLPDLKMYFISTRVHGNRKWGLPRPVFIQDKKRGLVGIQGYGLYAYSVSNPGKLITYCEQGNIKSGEGLGSDINVRITNAISQTLSELNTNEARRGELWNELQAIQKKAIVKLQDLCSPIGITVTELVLGSMQPTDWRKDT